MLCYFYCPDASIIIEDGKAVGIDLKHCKGCGICAKECPAKRHRHEDRREGVTRWRDQNTDTLAVTGNEAVAEAMRQINPDVVCAYPITPQTEVVQLYAQMVADGKVDHRVRHRGVGALGHERRHRLGGRRRAHHDRHLLPGLRPHVGAALRGLQLPAPHRHDHGQPGPLRPHQHPLRPQRHHGRPRHRLDPDLRRGPPAGLRQLHAGHPHRRAHGRAHCPSCTCTTATSSAGPSGRW